MSRDRTLGWAALGCAVALYLGHAVTFGVCLQDDAFISLRYSRFFATGYGPIYNLGEYVEGYTNFSWTVLGMLPFWLGLDPPRFLIGLGYLSGVLAVLGAAFLAHRVTNSSLTAAASAGLVVAVLPSLVAESVMGLETAGFAACICFALGCFMAETNDPTRIAWSGRWFGLAALTRPEGVMVAGLCWLLDAQSSLREKRITTQRWRRWLWFAVPVVLHLLFRIWFYHDIVPNTFHAKVGGGLEAIKRGLGYIAEFVAATWPLWLLAAIGASALLRDRGRPPRALIAIGVTLIFTAYVVYVGGDYKPTFRFFATPAVLLAALAGVGVDSLARSLFAERSSLAWVMRFGLLALASLTLLINGQPAREFARWRADELPTHRAAGRWLKENFPPDTLLATGNAGVLPYESELTTIDMYGLCDKQIAQRVMPRMGLGPAGHEKGDGRYVLDRKPDVILIMRGRFSDQPLTRAQIGAVKHSVSEAELWDDPRFEAGYKLESARLPGFYFNYFRRIAP